MVEHLMLCLDYSSAPLFMLTFATSLIKPCSILHANQFDLQSLCPPTPQGSSSEAASFFFCGVMGNAIAKKKRHGFSNKCASLVKEQRARLYILRRCATMLLCWYIQGDD
ncbi:hypothetical protein RJT34_20484 [Clitoria ternatea]|uniref:ROTUNDIFOLIA like 8 n=1 Tax=Clitoria ternatea TaxID=43366 RepID=A0AAN9IT87_CLITE